MNQKHTNKPLLLKGIKFLALTIVFICMSTLLITQAYKNVGHQWFWPVFIVGLIFLVVSIWQGFRGIRQIVKAIFEGDSQPIK